MRAIVSFPMLLPSVLSALGALWALAGAAPAVASEPACTVVVGHGRNLSLSDHEANTAWNQLNNRFNAQVAGRLQEAGWRIVRVPLPVESRDMPANARFILDRAQDAGCERVLETTIFADDAARVLVVRLRAHPIRRVRNLAGDGAMLAIGEPDFSTQREMTLDLRSLDRLAPEALARDMAADFVRQHPAPAASAAAR